LASTGSRAGRSGSGRFLPPDPRVETPYRFTPQLAVRIGILAAVALLVFGVLFFRLWALQVLSGPQYLRAALDNQLRSVRIEAPRGQILDDKGRPLVTNTPGTAIEIHPADLPKTWAAEQAELQRLSKIVHVPVLQMLRGIAERKGDPVTPVVIREDIKRTAPVNYLYEHEQEFPGVSVTNTYLRSYPSGSLAPQLLGYVNEISAQQLKTLKRKGYAGGDKIGESGVEGTYDFYLRGRDGLAQLRVDSLGRPRSPLVTRRQPMPGESVKLTLDLDLQRAAQNALIYGIDRAQANRQYQAAGGAIVAMDPQTGAIKAMTTWPTYNPNVYSGHVTTKRLAAEGLTPSTAEAKNFPSLDRATSGVYPAGSTFKPVTALAALETGVLASPSTELECTGSFEVPNQFGGPPQVFHNVDPGVFESMTLPTALGVSCDTWFYQLGYDFYLQPPSAGHPLQAWASKFGFGRKTGVDVGPESSGLLPTPEWRRRTFTAKTDPNWRIDREWHPGDSVQLAIGQKDLLVTPLQMARFYSLLANNGKLVRPYLAEEVQEGGGNPHSPPRIVKTFTPMAPQSVGLNSMYLAAVQDGLWQATHGAQGTATSVFGNFPIPIAGKTGTAQKRPSSDQYDQSWWCGYGPYGEVEPPQLVVCALIENGGFGADAAAPAALKVFQQYFHKRLTTTTPTTTSTQAGTG
jgi:penicillin-binding protein 2